MDAREGLSTNRAGDVVPKDSMLCCQQWAHGKSGWGHAVHAVFALHPARCRAALTYQVAAEVLVEQQQHQQPDDLHAVPAGDLGQQEQGRPAEHTQQSFYVHAEHAEGYRQALE